MRLRKFFILNITLFLLISSKGILYAEEESLGWDSKNNAHIATWMVEMTIAQLDFSFSDSPSFTMNYLNSRVSPPDNLRPLESVIDMHMREFFTCIRLYEPRWRRGITYQEGQDLIRAVIANSNATIKDLAAVVDLVLQF